MASKPKKAKARKVVSETQERPKSPKQDKPSSADELVKQNGRLVEELFASRAWTEIVFPLIEESIAGVSGRFTNGRYWHGTLTTKWDGNTSIAVAFYQKALMEFHNNLHDFIVAKDKLIAVEKAKKAEETAPIIDPFMESENEET